MHKYKITVSEDYSMYQQTTDVNTTSIKLTEHSMMLCRTKHFDHTHTTCINDCQKNTHQIQTTLGC